MKKISLRGLKGYIKNDDLKMCNGSIAFDGQYMEEMIIVGSICYEVVLIVIIIIMAVRT